MDDTQVQKSEYGRGVVGEYWGGEFCYDRREGSGMCIGFFCVNVKLC